MARDEVDASLIVNEPRKRRILSYITNDNNNSADKAELIKRLEGVGSVVFKPVIDGKPAREVEFARVLQIGRAHV